MDTTAQLELEDCVEARTVDLSERGKAVSRVLPKLELEADEALAWFLTAVRV